MPGVPRPTDERPHAPGDGAWAERWRFEFATADGHLGGTVDFERRADHVGYRAAVVGREHPLLLVVDDEVPFRSSPFEIRTTGLWADHTCETPLDHWTIGLEAFALGVDDPLEAIRSGRGDRVPLGFDLEWETDGPIEDDPASPGTAGYGIGCRVVGEVLLGDEAIDLDAPGWRTHQWGSLGQGGGWLRLEDDRWWQVPEGGEPAAELTTLGIVPRAVPEVPGLCTTRAMVRARDGAGGLGVGWVELGALGSIT